MLRTKGVLAGEGCTPPYSSLITCCFVTRGEVSSRPTGPRLGKCLTSMPQRRPSMPEKKSSAPELVSSEQAATVDAPKSSNRRAFLGQVGAAATLAAGALAAPAAVSAANGNSSSSNGTSSNPTQNRVNKASQLRVSLAAQDQNVPYAKNVNNGDDSLYADKAGTYTKGLAHDSFGRVTAASYASFKTALASGKHSDFENIILGGTRTLNGPQGGLAFDLEALDNTQFGQPQVPPAPPIASDQSATELLEHYWASLLRDVSFIDYGSSTLAVQAAAELGSQPTYFGPRNGSGQVTPNLLFRGAFPGETLGPYLSQFFIRPTALGAQPISQQLVTYLPDTDYMTS